MGGDYIPSSFVTAPDGLWPKLSTVIADDDWYRFAGITRDGPNTLLIRNGDTRQTVPINDDLIEVFHQLQSMGPDSAIAFDRMFRKCWLTTWSVCEPFLDRSMAVDDEA